MRAFLYAILAAYAELILNDSGAGYGIHFDGARRTVAQALWINALQARFG